VHAASMLSLATTISLGTFVGMRARFRLAKARWRAPITQ
jgi:hypothetical protein